MTAHTYIQHNTIVQYSSFSKS